jgi:hypothetical protein
VSRQFGQYFRGQSPAPCAHPTTSKRRTRAIGSRPSGASSAEIDKNISCAYRKLFVLECKVSRRLPVHVFEAIDKKTQEQRCRGPGRLNGQRMSLSRVYRRSASDLALTVRPRRCGSPCRLTRGLAGGPATFADLVFESHEKFLPSCDRNPLSVREQAEVPQHAASPSPWLLPHSFDHARARVGPAAVALRRIALLLLHTIGISYERLRQFDRSHQHRCSKCFGHDAFREVFSVLTEVPDRLERVH